MSKAILGFILCMILATTVAGVVLFSRRKPTPALTTTVASQIATPSAQVAASATPSALPVVEVKRQDSLLIALRQKYGQNYVGSTDVQVGKYAQGSVKIGGREKWWLATSTSGTWQIVVDGMAYVNCSSIAPYHFPKSVVPACWSRNTLVNR